MRVRHTRLTGAVPFVVLFSRPVVSNSITERAKIKNWEYVESQTGSTFIKEDRRDIGLSAKRKDIYILLLCTYARARCLASFLG